MLHRCNHPEKAVFLENNTQPVIEGQLKEKKGKWRLFRRWRTRYFTLSGAHLSCKGSVRLSVAITTHREIKHLFYLEWRCIDWHQSNSLSESFSKCQKYSTLFRNLYRQSNADFEANWRWKSWRMGSIPFNRCCKAFPGSWRLQD